MIVARPRRYSLRSLLAFGVIAALSVGWYASARRWQLERNELLSKISPADPPSDRYVRTAEITIAASELGSNQMGASWFLSVNADGQAALAIPGYPYNQRRSFIVDSKRLGEFRELLVAEKFFHLAEMFGDRVPDSSTSTLMVSVGDRTKTVRIGFMHNWTAATRPRADLEDAQRALKVWNEVEGWTHSQDAVAPALTE